MCSVALSLPTQTKKVLARMFPSVPNLAVDSAHIHTVSEHPTLVMVERDKGVKIRHSTALILSVHRMVAAFSLCETSHSIFPEIRWATVRMGVETRHPDVE